MQPKSRGISGPALIMIAALLWGIDGIIRRSLFSLPPITIVFFEHLVGFLILLPFVWKRLFTLKLQVKEIWFVAFIALFSSVLGTLWFTAALQKTQFVSFSVVFLIQKLQPVFAVTTAAIFLKERPTKTYWMWAGLAVVAAYFVTFPGGVVNFATGEATIGAALLALGAAWAWGSSTTFSKMALRDQSSESITALRFLFAAVIAFVFVFAFGKGATLGVITLSQFARFVIIALSSGMVGLLIYYKGLRTTPVRVSAILELTFPLVAVLIDIFLYKTTLAISQYVAAAILLFAMWQLARHTKEHTV